MTCAHNLMRPSHCRGYGLLQFIVVSAALATGIAWSMPVLDRAATAVKLSTAANVLLHQLEDAQSLAARSGGRMAACPSDDGVLCADAGGWEQGWIVFEDLDGNGLRGSGEAVVERVAALPREFRLDGSLEAGVFTLCSRDQGPGDARQIALYGGLGPHVRKVALAACS